MSKRFTLFLSILALGFTAVLAPAAFAVDEPGAGSSAVDSAASDADPAGTAPMTLTEDQIQAMQDAAAEQNGDRSVFEKASDFVSDNAPFFIIGIIIIGAVLAGIFILRGRPGGRQQSARPGAAPAAAPSKAELRRRKRAAIQRSREEQRLRRRAGTESRQAGQRPAGQAIPGAAASGFDPVEAEKQAAREQQQRETGHEPQQWDAATVRTGAAIPAPYSPSQNAPAPGVVTPSGEVVPPASPPGSPPPAPSAPGQAGPAPASAGPASNVSEPAKPGPASPAPATSQSGSDTSGFDPTVEAPGPDATVGKAAAAFVDGGVAGAAAGRAAAVGGVQPAADTDSQSLAGREPAPGTDVGETPAGTEPDVDKRLKAKLDEFRTGRPGQAFREFDPIGEQTEQPDPDDQQEGDSPKAELSPGLAAVERRLSADRVERDRTLRDAEERLHRIEQRAQDAELRAAFAERLAELKVEESDRERRLQEVVTGIDQAEKRAKEAEERARSAELAATAALDHPVAPIADVPEEISRTESEPAAGPAGTPGSERRSFFSSSPGRGSGSRDTAAGGSGGGSLNLNRATFEELREAELSVTQATRVLAYRERFGGYQAIEDLERVPGFPADLVDSLRSRFTV